MIFLNELDENWIVDRFRREWYEFNGHYSTTNIKEADIIWIIAPWTWKKIPKHLLKSKKVICTVHHIDESKFKGKSKKIFFKRDKYVDEYHVISNKTYEQLRSLTNKKINTIPFWINQNIWFEINDKNKIFEELNLKRNKFYIGSFQRDTEGKDLISPKLSKGPDKFLELVEIYHSKNKDVEVILTGKRRQFVMNGLKDRGIKFTYFEMASFDMINKLYNILDLYIVSSRFEGGPQSIMECAITKTPLISTNVGIASQILATKSIFSFLTMGEAVPDTAYAFQNIDKYIIPNGFKEFDKMFEQNES